MQYYLSVYVTLPHACVCVKSFLQELTVIEDSTVIVNTDDEVR